MTMATLVSTRAGAAVGTPASAAVGNIGTFVSNQQKFVLRPANPSGGVGTAQGNLYSFINNSLISYYLIINYSFIIEKIIRIFIYNIIEFVIDIVSTPRGWSTAGAVHPIDNGAGVSGRNSSG